MRRTPLLVVTLALSAVLAGIGSTTAMARQSPAPANTASAATRTVVQRLVTRSGHLAAGVSFHSESRNVDCGTKSPVAVDNGIRWCGSTADYLPACYRGYARHYPLCVRNPFGHDVVRVRASFPASQPVSRPAVPFGLVLDNGVRCHLRLGGAGARLQQHPSWVAYYYCTSGLEVFASPHREQTAGINTTYKSWTVPVAAASGTQDVVTHHIVRAYFVGFAA